MYYDCRMCMQDFYIVSVHVSIITCMYIAIAVVIAHLECVGESLCIPILDRALNRNYIIIR